MNNFQITIQRKSGEGWPVILEHSRPDAISPIRTEGELRLDDGHFSQLVQCEIDPRGYGEVLGRALFSGLTREAFLEARARDPGGLSVLLFVEDKELQCRYWGRLCAPVEKDWWDFLLLDQRAAFSLFLPSTTDRTYRPIGHRDLRALLLVAKPDGLGEYSLDDFDVPATVASLRRALDPIPCEVLAAVPSADGPPTLEELSRRLTEGQNTLLHVVAHGQVKGNETYLYLADPENQVERVAGEELIRELRRVKRLPHLFFLTTCHSAQPQAGLGGLAQRLVGQLGLPAVVAMGEAVSIASAEALATTFYRELQKDGSPDTALAKACAGLTRRHDVTVPGLYSRLGGRPLFSDTPDRKLTASEVEFGLSRLEAFLPERAPMLQEEFAKHASRLRGMLGADCKSFSEAVQDEWKNSWEWVTRESDKVLDLKFPELALGKSPPAYDNRCPFPGLLAFGSRFASSGKPEDDDRSFFFGRQGLVKELVDKLKAHPFLAVVGGSGSGKSSLVLAGLVPLLVKTYPGLRTAYMTPGWDPLARLDSALGTRTSDNQSDRVDGDSPPGADKVPSILVVDQFEELFRLTQDDNTCRAFVKRMLELTERCFIVLTMRADFWGDCAPYAALRDAMLAHQMLIAPMTSAELRSAMEQQAASVGLRFEADLSNTILDAVEGEPGAMPLLQHLLLEMWKRRHGRWLRASEYRALGGIKEAIAHTADSIYASLSPVEQAAMRNVFVRLTHLDEGVTPDLERRNTRRRAALAELVPARRDPAQVRSLVHRLADARLVVVSSADEVEVAHEALIRHWKTLQEWLVQDQAAVALRQSVQNAAAKWNTSRRPDLLVHKREQLRSAMALSDHPRVSLSSVEVEYLSMCRQSARSTFHATIGRGIDGEYPVVVEYVPPESWLPIRQYSILRFDDNGYDYLKRAPLTSHQYGMTLGRALFTEELYFSFVQAWVSKVEPLRVCITIEDPKLKLLHWEKLHAPLNNGQWDFLSTTSIYSLDYDPAVKSKVGPLDRNHLRALIFIADPTDSTLLDLERVASNIRDSLSGVECDLLGRASGSCGAATLGALCERLATGNYPIVHVAGYGWLTTDDAFIEKLKSLRDHWTPPLLLYIEGGRASDSGDRGERGMLGTRLVTEVGIPAVLAMTRLIPITTSMIMTRNFYRRFLEHGEPDRALSEVKERLFLDRHRFVPFIYSCLHGKSLFPEKDWTKVRQRDRTIDVEITVHSGERQSTNWIVTSTYRKQGWLIADRQESILNLSLEDLEKNLVNPRIYGTLLGQALFHPSVAARIIEDVTAGASDVGIQLIVEASELKELRWEWLSLATQSGIERFVASLPGVLFSQVVFSSLNQKPPCLDCEHLNALAIVAVPEGIDPPPLAPVSELVEDVTSALGGYSCHVLASNESDTERPTSKSIFGKMHTTQYAIINLIVHAILPQSKSDVIMRLEKASGKLDVFRLRKFLGRLNAVRYLPQLAFLMSPCPNDVTAVQGLSRMARSLVEDSGVLAAVAASGNMSKNTSNSFCSTFYRSLRVHGMVDRAYSEACAEANKYPDFVPPALFSRLRGSPLFYCQNSSTATGSTEHKTRTETESA